MPEDDNKQDLPEDFDYGLGGDRDTEDEDFEGLDRGDSLEPPEEEGAEEEGAEEEGAEEEGAEEEEEGAEEEGAEEEEGTDEGDNGDDAQTDETENDETAEETKEDRRRHVNQNQRIPKQRFDEVNNRMKAAEARARQLEAELQLARGGKDGDEPGEPEFDFDAKDKEYAELILDGEVEKAQAVRAEIRAAELELFKAKAAPTVEQAANYTREQMEYLNVGKELENEFAEFDPNSDVFDEALVEEITALVPALAEKRGISHAEALGTLARKMALAEGLVPKGGNADDGEAPPEPKAAGKGKPAAKKPNVARNKKAAAKQPPSTKGVGKPAEEQGLAELANMSEDEFASLPASKLAELRGDFL